MNRRLLGLLILLAALGFLRWMDPLREKETTLVEAAPRALPKAPASAPNAATEGTNTPEGMGRAPFQASTGNAFKPRGAVQIMQAPPNLPPAPHRSQTVMAVNAEAPPAVPAQAPPPPPPPLQVIGTWDDGSAPGVFVAGPQGTLLVRPGQTILDDYKVLEITKRELILKQASTQRDWPLSIPTVAATPPMYLKK